MLRGCEYGRGFTLPDARIVCCYWCSRTFVATSAQMLSCCARTARLYISLQSCVVVFLRSPNDACIHGYMTCFFFCCVGGCCIVVYYNFVLLGAYFNAKWDNGMNGKWSPGISFMSTIWSETILERKCVVWILLRMKKNGFRVDRRRRRRSRNIDCSTLDEQREHLKLSHFPTSLTYTRKMFA